MENANNLGGSGCVYFLLSCVAPFIPILLLREKARDRYNIEVRDMVLVRYMMVMVYMQGSTCDDVMVSCFCHCCANIQIANEIKERGDKQ